MFNLNDLKFQTFDIDEIEATIHQREQIVQEALANQDLERLQQISEIDKINLAWLNHQKNAIKSQLNNTDKIKKYLED